MARKFKHGWAFISHKKGRSITAGGGGSGKGSMRSQWWDCACNKHGIMDAKGTFMQLKVGTPTCKKDRLGGIGCPKCALAARKAA